MIYINGLGYVDEGVYGVTSTSATQPSNITSTRGVSPFDDILSVETAKLDAEESTKEISLNDIFKEAAKKYNVSEDLLKAIGYHESRFQTDVVSQAGAIGVMQLMPSTAEYLGVEDPRDPYQNIMGAAKLLGKLSEMYDGNQSLMLAAYNAGSGNVEKYGGIPPFKETQEYVAKVLATLSAGVDVPDKNVSINPSATASQDIINTTKKSANNYSNSIDNLTSAIDDFYKSSNLDKIFSYDDYQLLMEYFENMLEIIASIGETSSTSGNDDDSGDQSLMNLFKLGGSTYAYRSNNLL